MKELFTRITTFILGTACFMMTTPIGAVATDIATVEIEAQEEIIVEVDMEEVSHEIPDNSQITMPSFGSSYANNSYNYYYLLNSNNMAVYNTLTCMVDPQPGEMVISLPDPIRVNLGQRGEASSLTAEEAALVDAAIQPEFLPGYGYLLLDYPEIFWQDTVFNYGYNVAFEHNEITDEYIVVINTIKMYFQLHPYYNGNIDLARQHKEQIHNTIANFNVEGETRLEKLKSMHDQLALLITYDFNANMPYTIEGSLIESRSVCEGYAEAFKLLCDREGIPCIIVVSSNHMWNHVQMEDGNWYSVDNTWDDYDKLFDEREFVYDNFLKGMITSMKNGHFTATSLYGLPFKYPELSRADYALPEEATATTTTLNTPVVTTTTTTIAPIATTTNVQYKVDVESNKCDANSDGNLTVVDVVICQASILTFGSEVDCDVNNDGTSNVFDLMMMKRMLRKGETA